MEPDTKGKKNKDSLVSVFIYKGNKNNKTTIKQKCNLSLRTLIQSHVTRCYQSDLGRPDSEPTTIKQLFNPSPRTLKHSHLTHIAINLTLPRSDSEPCGRHQGLKHHPAQLQAEESLSDI